MFTKLDIKNFQSHKKTTLDFVPGINVIVGTSDTGKSAIARALKWVCKNKPSGFRFHSDFTEDPDTEVILTADDTTVGLHKDSKGATYTVDDETFKGISQSIPDVVEQKLNLSDLNFAYQQEMSYLILDSPGLVGKELNKITKLERVDEWVTLCTSKINGENRDIKLLKDQKIELSQELDELGDVEALSREFTKVENKSVEAEKCKVLWQKLGLIGNEAQELDFLLSIKNTLLKAESKVNAVISKIEEMKSSITLIELLEECEYINGKLSLDIHRAKAENDVIAVEKKINSIAEVKDFIELLQEYYKCSESILDEEDFLQCEVLIDKVDKRLDINTELFLLLVKQDGLYTEYVCNDSMCKMNVDILQKKIDEYKVYLKELGVCPTCNTVLEEGRIDEIIATI